MRFHEIRRAFRIPRFTRRHIEREVDDELAFHLEKRAEKLRASGMSEADATTEAARRFGALDEVRAECVEVEVTEHRRETLVTFVDNLFADLRFAARSLRKAPGFATVALVTLVLGIASVTSIFSYFNSLYLGTLPYRDANRIVALSERRGPGSLASFSVVSLDAIHALRGPLRSFDRVAAYKQSRATIMVGAEPQQVVALGVDSSFIPLFGIHPQLGRLIAPEEILNSVPVAMISDVLWRSHYGGDSAAIGKIIASDARDYRIVGVLPLGFRFPWQTDVLVPLRETVDSGETRASTFVSVIARLRLGVTRDRARAEMKVVATQLVSVDAKAYHGMTLLVRDEMLDRRARLFLPFPSVFIGAGFFLLLIACSNVTNLFYVRAARRRGEMAVRSSLGAGRGRLIRQALTESLLIGATAAALGTILAQWLVRLWLHFVPTQGFPSWFHVSIDLRVLLFSIGVMALVTVVVGLAPAREGTRFDLVRALKGASDMGSSSRHATRGSKRGLVLQLGLSMALFISAALLVRTFQKLATIDFGYPAARIADVEPLFDQRYRQDLRLPIQFATDIAARAATLPGVTGVAVRGVFGQLRDAPNAKAKSPASPADLYDSRVIPDGDSTRAARASIRVLSYVVSDEYFALLGLRLHTGRNFSSADVAGGPPVAVVGAYTARLLWGDAPAIGRTIQFGARGSAMTVVGVVDDVRNLQGGQRGFNVDPEVTVYVSTHQGLSYSPEILARGSGDVLAMRERIVELVRAADPMLIILQPTTLASQLEQAFVVTKVFGGVIAALAAAALALSVIGIYGVVAFGITQRTRELGIRIALGGTVDDVMKLILGETLRFVAAGLGAGIVLAVVLGRLLKAFLFGVSPLDPTTYGVVALLFGLVALLASWWPARRVTRIDPLVALRAD